MTTTKQCRECNEQKHLSEFYKNAAMAGGYFADCKDCFKTKRPNASQRRARQIAGRDGEEILITKLATQGIYSAPGKCSEWYWTDVVAWGCVRIEVKSANARKGRNYMFTFTPKQQHDGIQSDLIVLVMDFHSDPTFYVFPFDHPVFYHAPGVLKTGLSYTPNAKQHTFTGACLTDEIMEAHRDRWGLIEDVRLHFAGELR